MDWVVSVNLKRRHLSTGQQGIAIAKAAALKGARDAAKQRQREAAERTNAQLGRGGTLRANWREAPEPEAAAASRPSGKAVDEAAKQFGVPARTIERAITVIRDGAPELVRAVESGAALLRTVAGTEPKCYRS
ncbi:MAG: hypothetical protein ACOZNI_13010 [Myxococcota bacterium]